MEFKIFTEHIDEYHTEDAKRRLEKRVSEWVATKNRLGLAVSVQTNVCGREYVVTVLAVPYPTLEPSISTKEIRRILREERKKQTAK